MVSVALDWTLIVQLFNFLVLMVILNAFLYKPILKILKERESKFEGLKEEAQGFKDSLADGEKEKTASRARMLQEGVAAQSALKSDGQAQEKALLAEAQSVAAQKIEEARARTRAESAAAQAELSGQAAALAREIASKLLGREIPLTLLKQRPPAPGFPPPPRD
ncbi:MAG: hypothetical protein LBO66_01265 [Deltaproteobacteria bacterium]|jgi:F-type H+-transporting ATPase subunit b|nr:hypothetical protein [Deltaproteobacteria bacterium]